MNQKLFNTIFEAYHQEGIEQGMTDKQATAYAVKKFEEGEE